MKYRVIYRQSVLQEWQIQHFANYGGAATFKREQRRRLWAAVVQYQNAAGMWSDY